MRCYLHRVGADQFLNNLIFDPYHFITEGAILHKFQVYVSSACSKRGAGAVKVCSRGAIGEQMLYSMFLIHKKIYKYILGHKCRNPMMHCYNVPGLIVYHVF